MHKPPARKEQTVETNELRALWKRRAELMDPSLPFTDKVCEELDSTSCALIDALPALLDERDRLAAALETVQRINTGNARRADENLARAQAAESALGRVRGLATVKYVDMHGNTEPAMLASDVLGAIESTGTPPQPGAQPR